MSKSMGLAYLDLVKRAYFEGIDIYNERMKQNCRTVHGDPLTYNMEFSEIEPGVFKFRVPMDTTRQSYWKSAIAEFLGHLRGYRDAQQYADLGSKVWFKDANENPQWLANPNRRGENDMGEVYGYLFRGKYAENAPDQLANVIANLSRGYDGRGEIITCWIPDRFDFGCIRPCMHTHEFTLLGDKLILSSYQRSDDVLLGHNFNQIQVAAFNGMMGIATGNIPLYARHHPTNVHIYENQLPILESSGHLDREPFEDPWMIIDTTLPHTAGKTGLELIEAFDLRNFSVVGYECHEPISYPMSTGA